MHPGGRPHEERGFCSANCQREYKESLDRSALLRLMEGTEPPRSHQDSSASSNAGARLGEQRRHAERAGPAGSPVKAVARSQPLTVRELWRFPPVKSVKGPFFEESARLRFALIPEVSLGPPATAKVAPKVVPKRTVTPGSPPKAAPPAPSGSAPATIARPVPVAPAPRKASAPKEAPIDVSIGEGLGPENGNAWMKMAAGGLVVVAVLSGLFFGFWSRSHDTAVAPEVVTQPRPETWQPVPVSLDGGRQTFLFTPSFSWSDYRAQARVNRYIGLTWAFRARDDRAYVMELAPGRYQTAMKLTRFSVAGGQRSAPTVADVPVPPDNDVILVQIETEGTSYRLFLDGRLAAKWVQAELKDGGFGVVVQTPETVDWSSVEVAEVTRTSLPTKPATGRTR